MAPTPHHSWTQDVVPAALGGVVVLASWGIDLAINGLAPSPANLVQIHLSNPLHMVVDQFPFFLVWAYRKLHQQKVLRLERDGLRVQLAESKASRAKTRQLAGAIFDGLLFADPDGLVVAGNPASEVIFGRTASEMMGCPVGQMILGLDEADRHQRPRKTVRSEVLAVEYDVQGLHKSGARFPALVTRAPLEIDGRHGTLYVVRDTGDRVSRARTELRIDIDPAVLAPAEATGTSAKVLAELVGRIRGPVASLLGQMTSVRERLGPDQPELLRLQADAFSLFVALTGLSAHAKLESETLDLHVETVPVDTLVREAIDAAETYTRASNNWIEVVKSDVEATCEVDHRRAREILLALLVRANRGTDGGRIAVRAFRNATANGTEVHVEIEDPGEQMTKFELLEAKSHPDPESPSLELQVAHAIARQMGATLTLTSTPGGSLATLVIPSTDKPSIVPARSRRWSPPMREADDKRSRTALLIGAAIDTAQALRTALEGHHWTVDEEMPDRALRRVRDDRPDLLVFCLNEAPKETWSVWLEIKRHPILGLIPAMCIDDGKHAQKTWQTRLVSTPLDADGIVALASHLHAARIVPRALVIDTSEARRIETCSLLRGAGWWAYGPPTADQALELAADLPPELLVISASDGGILMGLVDAIRGTPSTREVPLILAPVAELSDDHQQRAARHGCIVLRPEDAPDMVVVQATIALGNVDEGA